MNPDPQPPDGRLNKFDQHAEHLTAAIRLCLEQKYIVPAMMLLFAGIDGMAWLHREHEGINNSDDFMQWVDRFLIHNSVSGTVTSIDFWANRNALLHEQSSNSTLTRSGKARPFLYFAKGQYAFPLTASWVLQPVTLEAEGMVNAFERGVKNFRSFIESSARREHILERCNELFNHNLD